MTAYILKRIVTGMVSLWFLITAVFFLVHLMPGNPYDTGNVSEQVLETIEKEYGLDQPPMVQYQMYIQSLLTGDLGMSMKKPGVSVSDILKECAPVSFRLGIAAFVAAFAAGTFLGTAQILTGNRRIRSALRLIQAIGMGVPNYVMGILLMLLFGIHLRLLPVSGITGLSNYILPAATLAIYPACVISRMLSTAAESERRKSYVRFLRIQGNTEREIFLRHLSRPVFSKMLVSLGDILGALLTGSFVAENIFTIPGLGREFVNAISNRDYTVVTGLTVFMGTVLILIQILLDVLQLCLEPETRMDFMQRRSK